MSQRPADSVHGGQPGRSRRLWTALASLASRSRPMVAAPRVLVMALALFLAVTVLAFLSLPDGTTIQWPLAVVLVLLVNPMVIVTNAFEWRVIARINGHEVSMRSALPVVVIASAANLLPLPGGVVVRTQALRNKGTATHRAILSNAAAGMAWLACGALAVAVLLALDDGSVPAIAGIGAIGFAASIAVATVVRGQLGPAWRSVFGQLYLVESATVALSGLRLFIAFRVIDVSATATESVAVSASIIVSAAVGIVPAGLGLREAFAGAIGAMVGVGAGAAAAATALDRITGLVTTALTTALLLRRRKASSLATEQSERNRKP